ncbi:uncharacterized protein TM35_000311380 [Trypanosoma theileri]|uniref:Uncharacterized protein n=1 Tax=Trypanosoma theileri TaxID=67003 RepID=A0A1X0NMJ1_9TRYP|nr:uncharacterized protein TM35_000311380 [Trypanosoma theileri]ORC85952.1 hypothetical protein TM35_000311380 [Trypanosoma theileri]
MRRCGLCYRRVVRRYSHGTSQTVRKQQETAITATLTETEREAAALACRLLDRHRHKQQQEKEKEKEERLTVDSVGLFNRKPAVDALTGYGKAFVMASVAHATDASSTSTQDLIDATDKKWDTLTLQGKVSAALGAASNKEIARTVVRSARSISSVRLPKKTPCNTTSFDLLLQRYGSVIPDKNSRNNKTSCTPHIPRGWQVNVHSTIMQGRSTLRSVLARKERYERREEWSRVWKSQLPDEIGDSIEVEGEGSVGSKLFSQTSNNNNNSSSSDENKEKKKNNKNRNTPNLCLSPVFRRHFLDFGSHSQGPSAFLTDPAMYYMLSHLRLTGEESLLEVRRKAESLTHRYNEYAKIS